MERVSPGVLGNVPTLRHAGHGMQIVRVFRDQSFEQGGNDVVLRHTGHNVRVHVLGFGAVAAKQNLLAVAKTDARWRRRATAQQGSGNRRGNLQMTNDEARMPKQSRSPDKQSSSEVNSDFDLGPAFGLQPGQFVMVRPQFQVS